MKTIALTRGFVTLVDDEDYEAYRHFKWYAQSRRGYFYAARWDNTVTPRRIISLHREIAGAQQGDLVDHKDGDQMNNQRHNLRVVNKSANNQNSSKRSGLSKYRGVRELRRKFVPSKWRAALNHDGIRYTSKCFKTELEAAQAYNEMVIQVGSFAPLNEVN